MRSIIIGDIHGCYGKLKEVLEEAKFKEKEDRLISLGDLMDRGNESYEVFHFFRKLKLWMKDRAVIIRGNHEQMMLEAVSSPEEKVLWYINGGRETVKSFKKHGDKIEHHEKWFEQNTVLYYQDKAFQCVHAGLCDEDPAKNTEDFLLWDRKMMQENGYQGRLTIIGHTPLSCAAYMDGKQGEKIALQERKRLLLPKQGMICIDTGCVFGNKLTAMIIEGEEFYLVSR